MHALFEAYGAVESVTIVKDRDTGQSRGFVFVEMTVAEQAGIAISATNGKLLNERALEVNEARPKIVEDLGSEAKGCQRLSSSSNLEMLRLPEG